jgi:hypothetical protein
LYAGENATVKQEGASLYFVELAIGVPVCASPRDTGMPPFNLKTAVDGL